MEISSESEFKLIFLSLVVSCFLIIWTVLYIDSSSRRVTERKFYDIRKNNIFRKSQFYGGRRELISFGRFLYDTSNSQCSLCNAMLFVVLSVKAIRFLLLDFSSLLTTFLSESSNDTHDVMILRIEREKVSRLKLWSFSSDSRTWACYSLRCKSSYKV